MCEWRMRERSVNWLGLIRKKKDSKSVKWVQNTVAVQCDDMPGARHLAPDALSCQRYTDTNGPPEQEPQDSSHWGQGVVFWSGTSQIHCKDMDKVLTPFPPGLSQLHSKCSLPVYSQFTHPVIFRDILNVFRAYYMCITSSTP